MAVYSNKVSPNFETLVKLTTNSEINSLIQFLNNKISKDVSSKITKISNIITYLEEEIEEMSDFDVIYCYFNIRRLSDKFTNSKNKLLTELKNIDYKYACSLCEKQIRINYNKGLLENLQNHVCNKSVTLGQCDLNADILFQLQEYGLYKRLPYSNKVKKQLFFKETIKKTNEVVYLYTIYIFEESFICLVCKCKISGPNNILQHVAGQNHIKNLNDQYDFLLAYHNSFLKLEAMDQVQQQKFCLVDNKKAECRICKQNVGFTNLEKHLKSRCFKKQKDAIQQAVPNFVNYHNLIITTIYNGLLDWFVTIKNVNYPILQNIESRVYCLACNTNVAKQIQAHISSPAHEDNVSKQNTINTIKKYHQVWCVQPLHVQVEQVYFRRRENKITCTLCSNFLQYDATQLQDHIKSINHKKYLLKYTDIGYQSSAFASHINSPVTSVKFKNAENCSSESSRSTCTSEEPEENTASTVLNLSASIANGTSRVISSDSDILSLSTSCSPIRNNITEKIQVIPYDKSVLDELYSDGLMHFTITIGFIKYPTIIKRGNYKHCFICNTDITTSVLLHANSSEHIQSVNSEDRKNLLKIFHDLWVSLPCPDQCRQVLFRVDDKLTCILCNKELAYDIKELKSHIDSWEHLRRIMSNYYNTVSTPSNSKLENEDGNVEIKTAIYSETLIDLDLTPNTKEIINNEKRDDLQAVQLEKLININPKLKVLDFDEVENTDKPVILESTKTNKSTLKTVSLTYSKEVIDELYGDNLIHYYLLINNVKYPFIQNMGKYKRCLICNIDLIGSVIFHINSIPHMQSISIPEKIEQLGRYHDLWLKFSESDQREQKYFEIGEKLTCALCDKELDYDIDVLTSHIFSLGHQVEAWSFKETGATENPVNLIEDASFTQNNSDKIIEAQENIELGASSNLNEDLSPNKNVADPPKVEASLESELTNRFYEQTVMDSAYLDLEQYTISIENIPYLYIQHRSTEMYCLICSKPFANIAEHVVTNQHFSRSIDASILCRVKHFHKIFLPLPPEQQLQQIHFKLKHRKLVCLVCGASYSYQNSNGVKVHLESDRHQKNAFGSNPGEGSPDNYGSHSTDLKETY